MRRVTKRVKRNELLTSPSTDSKVFTMGQPENRVTRDEATILARALLALAGT